MKKLMFLLMAAMMLSLVMVEYKPSNVYAAGEPDWVSEVPEETDEYIYWVGRGRQGTTITSKKGQAASDAKHYFVEWVGSTTKSLMEDWVKEAGESGKDMQALESFERAVKSRAEGDTSAFKEIKNYIASDGSYIALWRYPKSAFKKNAMKEFTLSKSAVVAEIGKDDFMKKLNETLSVD